MWSAPEALRSQLDQVASFPRCCGNEEGSKGPPWLPVFIGIRTPDPSNQTRSLNALGYRATYTVMFKIPSYINTELDSIDKMFDINKNNVCSLLFPISKSKKWAA